MTDGPENGLTEQRRQLVASLFEDLPADFRGRQQAVLNLRREFQQQLALSVAPAINAHIASMPQTNLEDKRTVATWTNAVLHEMGLRVKSGRGHPSIIVADCQKPNEPDDTSRYRLTSTDENGKVRRGDVTSGRLYELELMPAVQRQEIFSRSHSKPRKR
jgi:hypothetical protein